MSGPLPAVLAAYPTIGSWLDLDVDGRVTVFSGKVEFGQGIRTALAQLVAHELALPIERVTVAPVDTARSPDEGVTSGSRSIEEANEALRIVAAELRGALCRRAAARLGVASAELTVGRGEVVASDGRRIAYGQLVDGALAAEAVTGSVAPLPAGGGGSALGASVPRFDLPAKVTGAPAFVQDLELPGMLHGRILRPPSVGAQLIALDDAAIRAMPGVVAFVRDGSFVGAVAGREEEAIRALARMRRLATWEEDARLPESSRFMLDEPTLDVVVHERGRPGAAVPGSTELRAEYSRPYLAHASLGPSCAIATLDGDRYELWSHSQGIYHLRQELAKVLRTDEDRLRVLHAEGAGCYGANGADDVALDAALLARAVPGRPVRVQWMREDEFAWEPIGTAMFVRLAARLDADGRVVDWSHDVWGNGHRDRGGPDAPSVTNLLAARDLAEPFVPSVAPPPPSPTSGGGRNAAPPYAFANQRVVNHYVPRTPLRVSALRSLGAHANVFAAESFMDEIAASIGADPVEHRLRYLDDPRAREVIERVARRSGWAQRRDTPEGHGIGIGFARYKNAGCYVAVVAEVEIEPDFRLTRLWADVDAGLVVNPDGLVNQAEGGITQAASWTLLEEVCFDSTRVTTRDWSGYPILGFGDAPELDVEIVDRPDEPPVGVGEAFAGPTAASIGNAVFDATGVRIREMPFSRERLMRALA